MISLPETNLLKGSLQLTHSNVLFQLLTLLKFDLVLQQSYFPQQIRHIHTGIQLHPVLRCLAIDTLCGNTQLISVLVRIVSIFLQLFDHRLVFADEFFESLGLLVFSLELLGVFVYQFVHSGVDVSLLLFFIVFVDLFDFYS